MKETHENRIIIIMFYFMLRKEPSKYQINFAAKFSFKFNNTTKCVVPVSSSSGRWVILRRILIWITPFCNIVIDNKTHDHIIIAYIVPLLRINLYCFLFGVFFLYLGLKRTSLSIWYCIIWLIYLWWDEILKRLESG